MVTEPDSNYLKIFDSPDYVVSDIRITTRRVKETAETTFGDMKSLVATDINPFEDVFDPEIYDTEPITIDAKGTQIEHSTDDTVRSLGGFTFPILMY